MMNNNPCRFVQYYTKLFLGFMASFFTTFARIAHYLREGSTLSSRRESTTFAKVVNNALEYSRVINCFSRETCSPPEPLGRWPKGKARG